MRKIILVLLLLCAPVFAQNQNNQSTSLVSVAKIESGQIAPSTDYIGTVDYYNIAKAAAERAGRVDVVSAGEGKTVKKDDALVLVNTDTLKHNIASAKAKIAQQKAVLEKNQRDHDRAVVLFSENAISEQRFQDSATELEIQTQLLAAAQIELKLYEEEMRKSVTKAPFDGIILKRYVNVGDWVNVGTQLYDVATRRFEVSINVPQSAVQYVKAGMTVNVKVNSFNHQGVVRAVIPQGNANLRTFPIKIDIAYDSSLMGGMDCTVSLPSGTAVNTLVVPRDAVISRNNNTAIFVVEENKAKMIPVKVTGYSGTNAGISSDAVKEGMSVITRGNERISNGQTVKITQ